jgi:hypothetical protein
MLFQSMAVIKHDGRCSIGWDAALFSSAVCQLHGCVIPLFLNMFPRIKDLGQYDAVSVNSGEDACKVSDMRTGTWTLVPNMDRV